MTRRVQHYDRYQQVLALHTQGFEQAEIAHRVGVSTRTIQKWLKAGEFKEVAAHFWPGIGRSPLPQNKFSP